MNILVLDDYRELVDIACLWLEDLGHTTKPFCEAPLAMDYFMNNNVDACLVDYSLSADGITGGEFISEVKKIKPMLCVLMTGSITPEELKAVDESWDVLLEKPEDFNYETIAKVFGTT